MPCNSSNSMFQSAAKITGMPVKAMHSPISDSATRFSPAAPMPSLRYAETNKTESPRRRSTAEVYLGPHSFTSGALNFSFTFFRSRNCRAATSTTPLVLASVTTAG